MTTMHNKLDCNPIKTEDLAQKLNKYINKNTFFTKIL